MGIILLNSAGFWIDTTPSDVSSSVRPSGRGWSFPYTWKDILRRSGESLAMNLSKNVVTSSFFTSFTLSATTCARLKRYEPLSTSVQYRIDSSFRFLSFSRSCSTTACTFVWNSSSDMSSRIFRNSCRKASTLPSSPAGSLTSLWTITRTASMKDPDFIPPLHTRYPNCSWVRSWLKHGSLIKWFSRLRMALWGIDSGPTWNTV
mmetsp:Transcript_23047/g.33444  ORF Transcript_23047/g.33444 Transcript_23047/m.33444 type:complete len:204 (-) Transcript_23047:374-985(-)